MGEKIPFKTFLMRVVTARSKEDAKKAVEKSESVSIAAIKDIIKLLEKLPTRKK